ncbi:MAG: hypothetical protein RL247_719, partial [Actinomycetota bacterium]
MRRFLCPAMTALVLAVVSCTSIPSSGPVQSTERNAGIESTEFD